MKPSREVNDDFGDLDHFLYDFLTTVDRERERLRALLRGLPEGQQLDRLGQVEIALGTALHQAGDAAPHVRERWLVRSE